jgi:hypothetical protein
VGVGQPDLLGVARGSRERAVEEALAVGVPRLRGGDPVGLDQAGEEMVLALTGPA